MLAVSDAFFQSETRTYAVATIAFLAGAHLLLLIFRRAFRRRLPTPEAGNAGRLVIVKTFALGRRRQLVVVRFDAKHKMIVEQAVTNDVLDMGLLAKTAEPAREVL